MSSIYNYGALRFKFTSKFENADAMYKYIRGILGEPTEITYKSIWNGEVFEKIDEVEHFEYEEKKGKYVVKYDYNTGDWYLDYLLIDSEENCQDLYVSLDFNELNNIRVRTLDKFLNHISEDCKLKIFEWYTGSDMPVDF